MDVAKINIDQAISLLGLVLLIVVAFQNISLLGMVGIGFTVLGVLLGLARIKIEKADKT